MIAQPAKVRKRSAVQGLRSLALSVGLDAAPARRPDLKESEFKELHQTVLAHCVRGEDKALAGDLLGKFVGTHAANPVPPPAAAADALMEDMDMGQMPAPAGFRLRATSCLFTWNSLAWAGVPRKQLWFFQKFSNTFGEELHFYHS